MNSVMDIMIALIITGILITIVLDVDFNVKVHAINMQRELRTQESVRVLTDIIEYDLRKIGHGLITPFRAVHYADTSRIIFSYDRDRSSAYDSVRIEYTVVPALQTPNPNDFRFKRIVNGNEHDGISFGVIRFRLRYFNQYGTELPTPVSSDSLSKIRSIQYLFILQNKERFRNKYAYSSYSSRVTPKNLLIKYGQ